MQYLTIQIPPKITSGLRFGTAAATSRGFNENDFRKVGEMISDILDSLLLNEEDRKKVSETTREKVLNICKAYPIYNEAF